MKRHMATLLAVAMAGATLASTTAAVSEDRDWRAGSSEWRGGDDHWRGDDRGRDEWRGGGAYGWRGVYYRHGHGLCIARRTVWDPWIGGYVVRRISVAC